MIPELKAVITSPHVSTPMRLWIEVHLAYDRALSEQPVREELVSHVWEYIRWCRDEYKRDDMWSALSVAFFEHLLDRRAVREDLPKRITAREAADFVPHASYFHSQEDVHRYLDWFEVSQGGHAQPTIRIKSVR
jgi:hypothetical protein